MTPAARQFQAWLDAFDTWSPNKFYEEHCSPLLESAKLRLLGYLKAEMGGLYLVDTEEDTGTRFVGVVQDHGYGHFRRVVLEVEPWDPFAITELDVRVIPTPPEHKVQRLSESEALKALEERLAEATQERIFSGAVVVARHGETIFSAARGMQDRENGIPNTTETRFNSASVTKVFTSTAIMQLVQKGVLRLDEPIGRYLPDYPHEEAGRKVTTHHLLIQTSGLFSGQAHMHPKGQGLNTLEDHMRALGPLGLEFEPGNGWAYSNFNYQLLGLLIERLANQGYEDYVREHIFEPAGMHAIGFARDQAARDAIGYLKTPEGQWRPMQMPMLNRPGGPAAWGAVAPAGGAIATVEDYKRYADALLGHRLLDASHTRLLTEAKGDHPGDDLVWGPGMRHAYVANEQTVEGIRWLSKTGCMPVANGELRLYPESGYVIVALANIAPPAAAGMAAFIGDRLPAG